MMIVEKFMCCLQMAKPKQKRVEEAKEALLLAQNNLAQKQASLGKVIRLYHNVSF